MSTNSDPMRRYMRPEPGRKYFNHMATWTGGYWHRHWLLSSGQYVNTSQSTRARLIQIMSHTIPSTAPDDDLAALTCWCGRIACRHHTEEP